jgi:hypothetical protein
MRVAYCYYYCFNHSLWNNHRKRQMSRIHQQAVQAGIVALALLASILLAYSSIGYLAAYCGYGTTGSGTGSRPICPGNLKSGVCQTAQCKL